MASEVDTLWALVETRVSMPHLVGTSKEQHCDSREGSDD